uniref:L1 transposable element RRM domain-containing protein n=1 Tax=Knipowitschia caucasica TaxID=637954 RepID=A0AAV2JBW3_KNICA
MSARDGHRRKEENKEEEEEEEDGKETGEEKEGEKEEEDKEKKGEKKEEEEEEKEEEKMKEEKGEEKEKEEEEQETKEEEKEEEEKKEVVEKEEDEKKEEKKEEEEEKEEFYEAAETLLHQDCSDTDKGHRTSAQPSAAGGRPRPLIVRFHYYQEKERIQRLAREKGRLEFRGNPLLIFPDFSAELNRRRSAFNEVKALLRGNDRVRYGLLYPARQRVSWDGETKVFDNPKKVFHSSTLDRRVPLHAPPTHHQAPPTHHQAPPTQQEVDSDMVEILI